MKKLILLTLITLTLFSCGVSKQTSSVKTPTETSVTQDGLSYETAIVIQETNEMSGIQAEYAWIKEHYPNCSLKQQSLASYKDKPYDIMTIFTSEGKTVNLYFDISNFFGKY
jgi:hypothetical protein